MEVAPGVEPRPEVTVQVIVTPATGLLRASMTVTFGGTARACTTSPVWVSPAVLLSCVGAPAMALP